MFFPSQNHLIKYPGCVRVLTKNSTLLSSSRNQKVFSTCCTQVASSAPCLGSYSLNIRSVYIWGASQNRKSRQQRVTARVHSLQHTGRLGPSLAVGIYEWVSERGKCFAARNATRDAVSWPSNEEGCTRRALFIASSATDTVRAYKKDRNRQNAPASPPRRWETGVWTRSKLNYVHVNGAES